MGIKSGKQNAAAMLPDGDRFIVRFKDEAPLDEIEKILKNKDFNLLADSKSRLFAISTDESFLKHNSDIIDYYEPDLQRAPLATTNDPITLPVYESIGINTAWDSVSANSDIIVAVLDTGVDRTHEDLAGTNILNGYDAVAKTAGVNGDSIGHGTGVTGIIAATANNELGIAGVAHGVTILPIKVSSSGAIIYSSDLIAGIRFAADAGAKIINMSVGGYSFSDAEQEAVNYALSKGCILIAASGNGGNTPYSDQESYPASYKGVISVASCTPDGKRSSFSQYNEFVDVAAPGELITMPRTENGESIYITDSGTSFSCALVSGIAALAVSRADSSARFGGEEFLSLIIDSCGSNRNDELGHGIINAYEIIRRANLPIITGVAEGQTYHDRVTIGFNRGEGFLNGEPFEDGDVVISNGRHQFTVIDNGAERTINFRLDYVPLSYEFKEFVSFATFDFERGEAFLDGFPYASGDKITASGVHQFVLIDGDEMIEKQFTLEYDLPIVFGVEDGKTYTHPIEIKILGTGEAELDGEKIFGEAVVATHGLHTLTLKSGNGAVSKSYDFTIDFPASQLIENDYAGGKAAVDDENGYFCLYGDSLVGARIYSLDEPEQFLHFLPIGRVYSHGFTESSLYLLTDEGVTVISRSDALNGESAITLTYKNPDLINYVFAEGTIYGFSDEHMYRIELERDVIHQVARLGFPCESAFYSNNTFCLLSPANDRIVRLLTLEDGIISSFDAGINLDGVPLCYGEGYLSAGYRLFDVASGKLALETRSYYGVKIENGILFTESRMIEIATGKETASFAFDLSDICTTDRGVYLFGLEQIMVRIEGGVEGAAAYYAAERNDLSLIVSEPINVYTHNLYFDKHSTIASSSTDEQNLYLLFEDRNAVFSFSLLNNTENASIPLLYTPEAVFAVNGYIAVTFKQEALVYIAQAELPSEGVYVELPAKTSSVAVGGGRFFAICNGRLFHCNVDGTAPTLTSTRADQIACDSGRVYTINQKELSVHNFALTDTISITTEGGKLFVGSGVAVGGVIYDKTLNSEFARIEDEVLGFNGNTLITEKGLYNLVSKQYSCNLLQHNTNFVVIGGNSKLVSIGEKFISISGYPNGTEISAIPSVDGIAENGIYSDRIVIDYSHGVGYLDGNPIASGESVADTGEHIFRVVLPCGGAISVKFKIEAKLESIEFLGGDRVMSIGETIALGVLYLPEGAGSVPVSFNSDATGITVSENGEVTAHEVGVYSVFVTAETDHGRFTAECKITVRDDLIAFAPEHGITIDRNNQLVLGLKPGTTAESVIAMLYHSTNVYVLTPKNSEAKSSEVVGTGYKIVVGDSESLTDELTFVIIGDTDGDGYISAYDLYVEERILRGYAYELPYKTAADINGDGIANDSDYRALKYQVWGTAQAEVGTPDESIFGLATAQTVTRIESGSIIDVAICISGCKYARGVSGSINFGEGLQFIEGESVGWDCDFKELDQKIAFFAYGEDGTECARAFKVVVNLKFRVTAQAGKTLSFSSEGLTASFKDGCRIIRFEPSERFVYSTATGDFNLEIQNAQSFKFSPDIFDYNIVIPYNSALLDLSVIRNIGQTVSVSGLTIPDSDERTITVTLNSLDGKSVFYTLRVRRDDEPRFDTNCKLNTLEIEGFRLEPLFSPDILEYDVFVPHGTESISLYCVAQNPSAQIVVSDTTLKGSHTIVTVTVGTPDGEMLVYTLNVEILPPEEESPPDVIDDKKGDNPIVTTVIIVSIALLTLAGLFFLYKRNKADEPISTHDDNEPQSSNQ